MRPDGKAQVELAKRAHGTAWPVGWVRERVEMRRPCAVVIDPAGPAGFLAAKLEQVGVKVVEPTARDVTQACVDLRASVNEGKVTDPETGEVKPSELVHTRDVVLAAAVAAAETKASGAWKRDSEKADISGLYAVTLALFGLRSGEGPSVYEDRGILQL